MNSFIENINYVAGLDNRYGSVIELYKNNLSLKSVEHDIELKFSYYSNYDKKIHSIVHSEPGVLVGEINDTLLSFKTLVESSITGSEFTCTVSSGVQNFVINNVVMVNINITSNNDMYKAYELEMKIVTAGAVTYDVFGEVKDSLKLLPSLAMITSSDIDAIVNVYEIQEDVIAVSESIANVETVSDSIANVNITGTNITNVNIVGEDITNVNTVSTHISNVNTVSGSIANVNTVATNIVGLNSIVSNITEILLADDNAAIATTKALESSDSAASADVSASEALVSATNAATSAINASKSATQSVTSAVQSANSASSANASAVSASSSASEALTSKNSATASASAALASENAAKISETNASVSEGNALNSANNATTKASEASTSATNASDSATSASSFASAASISETNAGSSEDVAITKASEAFTSANNASASEVNALASKNSASTSASTATDQATVATTKALEATASAAASLQSSLDSAVSASLFPNHIADTTNPHGVTKTQVGLGNADNTADANKVVASAGRLTEGKKINNAVFDNTQDITIKSETPNKVTVKFDGGATEGTDTYTFDGSEAKSVDIVAGINVQLVKTPGSVTINVDDTDVVKAPLGVLPALDGSQLTNMPVALPDQVGYAGKYLKTDGTNASWEEVSGDSLFIATPSIITPSNASTEIVLGPTVITSAYITAEKYSGVHTGSILEVAIDAGFTTIVQTVITGLTSFTVVGLADNTTYYLRVRYVSGEFLSDWSEVISFTTLDILINQPTITVVGSPSSISKVAVINGSAFATTNGNDTHASTNFRVVRTSDSVEVYTIAETTNKTSITVPEGILEIGVEYSFEAQYVGTQYGSSVYGTAVGTIANIYVSTPTLTVDGAPSNVAETPTLTTSVFNVSNGSDTHTGTTFTVKDGGVTVWTETKTTGDLLTTTVPAKILKVKKEYTFEAYHTGMTYGNSETVISTATTKVSFSIIKYGLQWNNISDTYTRLGAAASWTTGADFTNNETVQSRMRRCILNANGTVNYYLSATDSTKREDGLTAADLTGASGNVMVEIPKFWVKYDNTTGAKQMWISMSPSEGYVVHPAFVKNGVEVDYRYYRAYKGSVSGTKLISRSGVAAAGSETIAAFRTKAQANGTGWGLVDWNSIFAVQTLLFIEIGTFNSQSVLGNGNDTGSDYGMTTGGSNSIGNASSPATNDGTWMSYRGIENFYADIFEWIDGINMSERLVYTSNMQSTFASDVFTGAYTSTGVTLPNSGYIKNMSFSIKGFIPTESVGGSDSTYMTDYVESSTDAGLATFGGYSSYGLKCGAACLFFSDSSNTSMAIGAGLSF